MSQSTFYRRRARLQPWEKLHYDLITSKSSIIDQSQEMDIKKDGTYSFL
jgi:hypothetical protein